MSAPVGWEACQVHGKAKAALADPLKPKKQSTISRYSPAESKDDESVIPDPNLFDARRLVTGADSLPSVAQCAVHLELLQCFRKLRNQVINSQRLDQAWDIKPIPRVVYTGYRGNKTEKKLKDTTFQSRREAKWSTFIELAVTRFVYWLQITNKNIESVALESEFHIESPPLGECVANLHDIFPLTM